MQYQLRIYSIKPGLMDEFIAGWRENIIPVRRLYGFEVVGAWTKAEANEFVWIVAHPNPAGYAAAEETYYASPERSSMTWNPRNYIETMDLRILDRVEVDVAPLTG